MIIACAVVKRNHEGLISLYSGFKSRLRSRLLGDNG